MKLFSKKNITIFFILLTIILLTHSSYHAYNKYKFSQKTKQNLSEKVKFNNLNLLIISLEKEILYSAINFNEQNNSNLETLNTVRKKVNIQIKNSKSLNISLISQELSLVRKSINLEKEKYLTTFSEIYQKKIIKPILSKMKKLSLNIDIQNELTLMQLRESINIESSFLAFSIQESKVVTDTDLLFWEKVLEERYLPDFSSIKNKKLLNKINKVFDVKTFYKDSSSLRAKLFFEMKKGKYSISIGEWLEQIKEQKKSIEDVIKLLNSSNINYLETKLNQNKEEMYKQIIISLLILILLGLLFSILHILKKITQDELILKNTVKYIETDLDESKKREIKEILTHNSSAEVYEFLANEIKEPSRAKDLFLANMSHEIRTPLNGVIGFTKELKETKLSEEQLEIVEIIEESSNNLMHIVNDILDFSKIKAGKIKLEHISFDPIKKFEASIDTFVAKAHEKEIELKVYIDPEIPTNVLGDPTKITQILTNLISNAIKFTPTKGSIEITINQVIQKSPSKNIKLKFAVKDSGIGVSPKEKKEIFNAFSQADASTSRKYGGTGLGLSIASQFIKYMGGQLNIESEVNKGAKFFFSLSLEKPKNLQKRTRENLSNYRIGYIPPIDNSSINKILKTYIEFHGATFLTYTQRTLLNLDESNLPDLLYIDYKCFDREGDINYFLDLPVKIVLIMADHREKELLDIRTKIDKVLHKPVNFTRTSKSLEVLTKVKKEFPSKIKEQNKQFNNIHALVAEDNFINQKLMKSVLHRFGMEVTIVANGEEALNARKNYEYGIIFMDIQMPIMGGVEATKNILFFEKESMQKHIPIVALTANALEGDREKYMASGMDEYLSKPMDLNELKKVLNNFLN